MAKQKIDNDKVVKMLTGMYDTVGCLPSMYVKQETYNRIVGTGASYRHDFSLPNHDAILSFFIYPNNDVTLSECLEINIPIGHILTDEKPSNELTSNIRDTAKQLSTLADQLDEWVKEQS